MDRPERWAKASQSVAEASWRPVWGGLLEQQEQAARQALSSLRTNLCAHWGTALLITALRCRPTPSHGPSAHCHRTGTSCSLLFTLSRSRVGEVSSCSGGSADAYIYYCWWDIKCFYSLYIRTICIIIVKLIFCLFFHYFLSSLGNGALLVWNA